MRAHGRLQDPLCIPSKPPRHTTAASAAVIFVIDGADRQSLASARALYDHALSGLAVPILVVIGNGADRVTDEAIEAARRALPVREGNGNVRVVVSSVLRAFGFRTRCGADKEVEANALLREVEELIDAAGRRSIG